MTNKKIISQTLARHIRYKQNPDIQSLVPQKRGPKFKTRRFDLEIEEKIVFLRLVGNNRYEIREILLKEYIVIPCITITCNIYKRHGRHGLNKLTKAEKQEKLKIIMQKIGELIHID